MSLPCVLGLGCWGINTDGLKKLIPGPETKRWSSKDGEPGKVRLYKIYQRPCFSIYPKAGRKWSPSKKPRTSGYRFTSPNGRAAVIEVLTVHVCGIGYCCNPEKLGDMEGTGTVTIQRFGAEVRFRCHRQTNWWMTRDSASYRDQTRPCCSTRSAKYFLRPRHPDRKTISNGLTLKTVCAVRLLMPKLPHEFTGLAGLARVFVFTPVHA